MSINVTRRTDRLIHTQMSSLQGKLQLICGFGAGVWQKMNREEIKLNTNYYKDTHKNMVERTNQISIDIKQKNAICVIKYFNYIKLFGINYL